MGLAVALGDFLRRFVLPDCQNPVGPSSLSILQISEFPLISWGSFRPLLFVGNFKHAETCSKRASDAFARPTSSPSVSTRSVVS